jgi:hypothetical protein
MVKEIILLIMEFSLLVLTTYLGISVVYNTLFAWIRSFL